MPRRTRPATVLLSAAVLLAGCGAGDAGGAEALDCAGVTGGAVDEQVEVLAAQSAGGPLPAAELAVLDGSGCQDLADLVGTPLVVNFWATWCAFCVDEMPDLQQASEQLGDAVRFVGVDREDVRERALQLAAETGVDYLLVEDPRAELFRALEGRGMPTTVLVDAEGVVRYRHAGPLDADQLLALVEEHLGVRA